MNHLATYHIRGLISIIERWVETDLSLPQSEVIKLLHEVDYHIDGLFVCD